MKKILLILVSILLSTPVSYADSQGDVYSNDKALKGLTASRAYFDVTIGEPKQLLIRLQLVEKTYNQLVAAGVTPAFVIGIRGKASSFFTKGTDYVLDIDLPEKRQIEAIIKKLKTKKIGVEQCYIAAGFQEIDVADFLPEVELVANGYVSMIGYHSQGYGLVPMD
ncbi:MAG: hypothetical protein GY799_18020 [Desulfobulbaceae bacterium]|nr:hypothetical protein [Desulfobulbaceae bacterium]